MAFETKTIVGNKKTIMVYQTTDTIAVCSANDYFTENLVGQPIIILCSNGNKFGIVQLTGTHTVLRVLDA
jgi:hypothetical protein